MKLVDINESTWDNLSPILEYKFKNQFNNIEKDTKNPLNSVVGWSDAPMNQAQWNREIAYEHNEPTMKFNWSVSKFRGRLIERKMGINSFPKYLAAIMYNSILAECLTGLPIKKNAIFKKVIFDLEHHSNCPHDLINKFASNAERWFDSIRSCVINNGIIARSILPWLLEALNYVGYKGGKGFSNSKARRAFALGISKNKDFLALETRREQENYIIQRLKRHPYFKTSALMTMRHILHNMVDEFGCTILLPWTKEEMMGRNATNSTRHEQTLIRAEKIKNKIKNDEKLKNSEYVFRSHHKELFNDSIRPYSTRKTAKVNVAESTSAPMQDKAEPMENGNSKKLVLQSSVGNDSRIPQGSYNGNVEPEVEAKSKMVAGSDRGKPDELGEHFGKSARLVFSIEPNPDKETN